MYIKMWREKEKEREKERERASARVYMSHVQPVAFGVSFISISNLNLLGVFSKERSKRDLEN